MVPRRTLPVGAEIRRWIIEASLGSGGQATTYRARDSETGALVALKHFRLVGADSWKAVELFEREAKVHRELDHPSIPKFIDSFADDGEFYLVSELVDAPSLKQALLQGERWSQDELVDLARRVLEVLCWLHKLNPPVIHRDLKPSNLLRAADGRVTVIDFGAVQEHLALEASGGSTVVGTHGYMAPEQLMGRASPASDLYGLGTTLVHLATGHHPADLPSSGLELEFAELLQLPRPLVSWLERMCAADPKARPESAAVALEQLDAAVAGAAPECDRSAVAQGPAARRDAVTTATPQGTWKRSGAVLLAVGVLGLGGLAIAERRRTEGDSSAATTPAPTDGASSTSPDEETEGYAEIPTEYTLPEQLEFTSRGTVHLRPGRWVPISMIVFGGMIKNAGDKPLHHVEGVIRLRSYNSETRLEWRIVDWDTPPLEPGEERYVRAEWSNVPAHLDRAHVTLTKSELEGAIPEVTRLPLAVEGSDALPEGTSLELTQTRHWPDDDLFDVELRVNGLAALRWLELMPTCVFADGATGRTRVADPVFHVSATLHNRRGAREGDRFVHRVMCPDLTVSVRWRLEQHRRSDGSASIGGSHSPGAVSPQR
ncbi:MAG: serine/threonine protein kinase [Myxococcales bacterium]|nr:serine/threonine protein kinase [Myxococcales bacterium]